jgi:hypothetical protein
MKLVPQEWVTVKICQDIAIFEKGTDNVLFNTDTFEVSALPWGDRVMSIRIRPVPNIDDIDFIDECQYITCNVAVEHLEQAMNGIADSIFDLWFHNNNVFDQDMKLIHMTAGSRDISYFPEGYAAFQENSDKPVFVFKKEDWTPFTTYSELKRITNEILNVKRIVILDFRTKIKKVPRGCEMYINCVAGDDIDPSRF